MDNAGSATLDDTDAPGKCTINGQPVSVSKGDQRFCLGMHLQILTLATTWFKPVIYSVNSKTLCSLEKNEPKLLAKGSKKVFLKYTKRTM